VILVDNGPKARPRTHSQTRMHPSHERRERRVRRRVEAACGARARRDPPLRQHDVLVEPGWLAPLLETLRDETFWRVVPREAQPRRDDRGGLSLGDRRGWQLRLEDEDHSRFVGVWGPRRCGCLVAAAFRVPTDEARGCQYAAVREHVGADPGQLPLPDRSHERAEPRRPRLGWASGFLRGAGSTRTRTRGSLRRSSTVSFASRRSLGARSTCSCRFSTSRSTRSRTGGSKAKVATRGRSRARTRRARLSSLCDRFARPGAPQRAVRVVGRGRCPSNALRGARPRCRRSASPLRCRRSRRGVRVGRCCRGGCDRPPSTTRDD
jgi:hypothetical protein